MTKTILEFLEVWLAPATPRQVGQVAILNTGHCYHICHQADSHTFFSAKETAPTITRPVDARQVAKLDANAAFRPLKSAPNLRAGWLLELQQIEEVREALDYLYPAAIGMWLAYQRHPDRSVPLRETLNRQTGMYKSASELTDAEAGELIATFCAPNRCQRRILWYLDDESSVEIQPEKRLNPAVSKSDMPAHLPILCAEACNLLVGAARGVVKRRKSNSPANC